MSAKQTTATATAAFAQAPLPVPTPGSDLAGSSPQAKPGVFVYQNLEHENSMETVFEALKEQKKKITRAKKLVATATTNYNANQKIVDANIQHYENLKAEDRKRRNAEKAKVVRDEKARKLKQQQAEQDANAQREDELRREIAAKTAELEKLTTPSTVGTSPIKSDNDAEGSKRGPNRCRWCNIFITMHTVNQLAECRKALSAKKAASEMKKKAVKPSKAALATKVEKAPTSEADLKVAMQLEANGDSSGFSSGDAKGEDEEEVKYGLGKGCMQHPPEGQPEAKKARHERFQESDSSDEEESSDEEKSPDEEESSSEDDSSDEDDSDDDE